MAYYEKNKEERLGFKIHKFVFESIRYVLEKMGEVVGTVLYFTCDLLGFDLDGD